MNLKKQVDSVFLDAKRLVEKRRQDERFNSPPRQSLKGIDQDVRQLIDAAIAVVGEIGSVEHRQQIGIPPFDRDKFSVPLQFDGFTEQGTLEVFCRKWPNGDVKLTVMLKPIQCADDVVTYSPSSPAELAAELPDAVLRLVTTYAGRQTGEQ